jgi:predicted membrane chloride channel (bestrophin family)
MKKHWLYNFKTVVNLQSAIVAGLTVGITLLCLRFDIIADIPTSLIGIAVVFPIVFSINAAYRRREEGLRFFSSLKSHTMALFFAHRDWLPIFDSQRPARLKGLCTDLFHAVAQDLLPAGRREATRREVYRHFSALSRLHEELRAAQVTPSEVSRANQYLGRLMLEFELARNISMYRTPRSLRAYSRFFLNIMPIAFAPAFALLSRNHPAHPWVGPFVAVLYTIVLVTLDRIQEDLEDPFDGLGDDDINLDLSDTFTPLTDSEVITAPPRPAALDGDDAGD